MIQGDLRQEPKGQSNRERTECRIEASTSIQSKRWALRAPRLRRGIEALDGFLGLRPNPKLAPASFLSASIQ
jgi:hypothetical protein